MLLIHKILIYYFCVALYNIKKLSTKTAVFEVNTRGNDVFLRIIPFFTFYLSTLFFKKSGQPHSIHILEMNGCYPPLYKCIFVYFFA